MVKILFCAGAPDPNIAVLNEHFDVFVGVDGGAKQLVDNGITLDYAIGDFDSVAVQNARDVVVLPCEKDDTDLQYALTYVLTKYDVNTIDTITIIGALGGGRLDHLICNFYLAYHQNYRAWLSKMYFVEKNNSVRFYTKGTHVIKKEADKFYLSIIGMTPLTGLTIQNAKYTLLNKNTETPISYISNEFVNGDAIVSLNEGLLCIIQSSRM